MPRSGYFENPGKHCANVLSPAQIKQIVQKYSILFCSALDCSLNVLSTVVKTGGNNSDCSGVIF